MLPVDFSRLGDEVAALEAAGVDRIQWDVMDGQFVPNLTFGPAVIASARAHTTLPFEAHLMVLTPDVMAAEYVAAGCQRLIVHAEACTHLHRTLGNIAALGATAAVALNPATPASAVAHVLDLVDMVLVMTVNPGFGGQQYIATMEPKIREVRAMIEAAGLADHVDVEVDGGIGPATVAGAAAAGANVLVAGSALFRDPEGLAHAVTQLRQLATDADRLITLSGVVDGVVTPAATGPLGRPQVAQRSTQREEEVLHRHQTQQHQERHADGLQDARAGCRPWRPRSGVSTPDSTLVPSASKRAHRVTEPRAVDVGVVDTGDLVAAEQR